MTKQLIIGQQYEAIAQEKIKGLYSDIEQKVSNNTNAYDFITLPSVRLRSKATCTTRKAEAVKQESGLDIGEETRLLVGEESSDEENVELKMDDVDQVAEMNGEMDNVKQKAEEKLISLS